jgi:hypothetical protein
MGKNPCISLLPLHLSLPLNFAFAVVLAFLVCHPRRGSAFAFASFLACHSERSEEPPHFVRTATTAQHIDTLI